MHTSQSMSRQNRTGLIHKQRAMFSTPLTSRSQAKPDTSCQEDLVKTIANQGETDLKTSECPNRCRPPSDPIHQQPHPYSLCRNSQIECGLHANQVLSALAAHRTSHCRAMPGPSVALHYLSVGESEAPFPSWSLLLSPSAIIWAGSDRTFLFVFLFFAFRRNDVLVWNACSLSCSRACALLFLFLYATLCQIEHTESELKTQVGNPLKNLTHA